MSTQMIGAVLLRPLIAAAILMVSGSCSPVWAESPQGSATACNSANSTTPVAKQQVAEGSLPAAAEEKATQSGHKSGGDSLPGALAIGGVEWVRGQGGACYTLQLMAASSPTTLHHFISDKGLPAPLAVVASKPGDGGLYLLFQGSYGSRSEAQRAATQIEEMAGVHPWPRQFSALGDLYDARETEKKPSRQNLADGAGPIDGAAWLWSRNPEHYTVQLMSDHRRDRLHRFAEQPHLRGQVAIIAVESKGKEWYLLLAGDYESTELARQAIDNLPEPLRRAKPWPRAFSSLQEQMAAANHAQDWWILRP